MAEQQNNQNNYHDDEIDLRKLFQAIGNFFVNIGVGIVNKIIRLRRATLKYKILIGVFIIIGIGSGITFNQVSKPAYLTSMLLSSSYFNGQLVENAIDKLNKICEDKNNTGLDKLFNIPVSEATSIIKFDFKPFITEQDLVEIEVLQAKLADLKIDDAEIAKIINQIELQNKKTFEISVLTFTPDITESLETALVNYFKTNPYIQNRIEATRANLLGRRKKLVNESIKLDSLKKVLMVNLESLANEPAGTSNNVYVGDQKLSTDPLNVYRTDLGIHNEILSIDRSLKLQADFELIDGFTAFSKPESPGLIKTTAVSAAIFLGLAYLIIIFIEINKYLNRIEEERFGSNN